MTVTAGGTRLVGTPVQRVEDPRYTTGRGRYLDDLTPPGTLYMRVVRSEIAAGRIEAVTIGEFEAPPAGTILVSGTDTTGGIRADVVEPSWQTSLQPALADDRVRYVGEPVAAVLHQDPYAAEDAAELVVVEYDVDAEPVIDLGRALAADAPRVHAGWQDNCFMRRRRVFGDVAAARRAADRVVRRAYRTGRQAGVPLEGRGCLAVPDPAGDGLTLWSSTQIPHLVRTAVARDLGLPEHSVRVVAPDVGGGFGVKAHVFPEELLAARLAHAHRAPVKWVEDRSEHLLASIHARDHLHVVEACVASDGRLLAVRAQLVVDAGAYSLYPWSAASDSGMAAKVLLGPYDIQAYEVEDIAVATNKCPLGTYRGVARPSAVFTMERLVDDVARELGLDPLDVRERNAITSFPYRTAYGLEYDSGSYLESLALMREQLDYENLAPELRRDRGDERLRGVGIALYNEQTAHGTDDFERRKTPIESGYEAANVRMGPDGDVTVYTALQSHGQSLETTLAQVVADELGVPFERIRVVHGDTASCPHGVGTWGSRGAVLGGGAARGAALQVREKLAAIAAHELEAEAADIVLEDGVAFVRGSRSRSVDIRDIAYWANRRTAKLPPGMEPGLDAVSFLDGPSSGTFSNACHGAIVAVDRRTGRVELERYVVVEDCGTMLNPMVVDGQVHGGVAQGIGSALLEEVVYSSEGQPLSTTFAEYLMPTSMDVPAIEVHHLETPSPLTPFGAKGMGEAGAIGPMAAIANAVSDALGTGIDETPLRMERVWKAAAARTPADDRWRHWSAHPSLAGFWKDASDSHRSDD